MIITISPQQANEIKKVLNIIKPTTTKDILNNILFYTKYKNLYVLGTNLKSCMKILLSENFTEKVDFTISYNILNGILKSAIEDNILIEILDDNIEIK